MKDPLEIIIFKDGLKLCHPTDNSVSLFVPKEEGAVTEKIASFINKVAAASGTIHLFVAEDLLFFKSLTFPKDTLDLKEAVGYQMELLTPFADESTWHSFESVREESAWRVTLYAARSQFIDVYVQEIIDAGYHITGLYPESQRFVNKLNRKGAWGLLLPGHFIKAYLFQGAVMKERLLCSTEPTFSEAVEVCCTDLIFRLDPQLAEAPLGDAAFQPARPCVDFLDARFLLNQRPILKSYNMLPATYQRPDYSKIIIAVLLILNLITLASFAAVKAYRLHKLDEQVTEKIAEIMPLVKESKALRQQETGSLQALSRLENVGRNLDLITFLHNLTTVLPKTSYLDQIRVDTENNSAHIQGYTDDINELTSSLQNVGTAQLKSTSRRKDKIYFDVEVNLP